MCALELAGHLLKTQSARPCTRQVIGGSELKVVCSFRPVPKRLSAFTGCFLPVGGRPGTVVGCFGSIGRRSRPVPPRPRQNVVPTRALVVLQIVQTSEPITAGRATITKRRGPIALSAVRSLAAAPSSCTADTARRCASAMDDHVAAGREIIVGSVLILIRTSLIAFTCALVVIRPRLILVAPGLVAIRPRLILVALDLAAIDCAAITD